MFTIASPRRCDNPLAVAAHTAPSAVS